MTERLCQCEAKCGQSIAHMMARARYTPACAKKRRAARNRANQKKHNVARRERRKTPHPFAAACPPAQPFEQKHRPCKHCEDCMGYPWRRSSLGCLTCGGRYGQEDAPERGSVITSSSGMALRL